MTMKLAFGCDPNAVDFKKQLMKYATELGCECVDYGSDDPIYANVAFTVAKEVAEGKCARGVLLCGTGMGVAIAANKVKGAYAVTLHDVYQAERAQLSNNANIITMGSQVLGVELAKILLREYLNHTYDPQSRSGPKVARIAAFESEG